MGNFEDFPITRMRDISITRIVTNLQLTVRIDGGGLDVSL